MLGYPALPEQGRGQRFAVQSSPLELTVVEHAQPIRGLTRAWAITTCSKTPQSLDNFLAFLPYSLTHSLIFYVVAGSQFRTFKMLLLGSSQHAERLTVSHQPLQLLNQNLLIELQCCLSSLQASPESGLQVLVISSADKPIWIYQPSIRMSSPRTTLYSVASETMREDLLR